MGIHYFPSKNSFFNKSNDTEMQSKSYRYFGVIAMWGDIILMSYICFSVTQKVETAEGKS